jgi:hypothetical protein
VIFLFALSLVASEPQLPVLCVDASGLESSEARGEDIVVAVRARMGRRKLRVVTCPQLRDEPTWRATVEPSGASQLALSIRGGFEWNQQIDVQGLRQAQIAQVVALYIVESVRPSVDALLVQLGIDDEPAAETDTSEALAVLESKEPPERRAAAKAYEVELQAGPALAVDPFSVSAYGQLGCKLRLEPVSLTLTAGVRSVGAQETLGVRASGVEVHAAFGAMKRWQRGEAGLLVRGRMTDIAVSGDHANVRHGERAYWDYGVGVSGVLWLQRWESVDLGLAAQGWVWARPHKLTVEGHELLRQSRVDFFVGPTVSFKF